MTGRDASQLLDTRPQSDATGRSGTYADFTSPPLSSSARRPGLPTYCVYGHLKDIVADNTMTYFIIALAVALVAFLAYRLIGLRAALDKRIQPLMDAPALKVIKGGLPETGHMVWASETLEHNEHGFITTPLVPCQHEKCHCRTFPKLTRPQ